MKHSEKCKEAGLKSLADYIEEKHGGNNAAFARSIDVERHQVQQYLSAKKPVYVCAGKLVQVIRDIE